MGKRGTWFSAIKSLFTSNSKLNEPKEKKGVRGRLKHGSFLPRFREPSSIEKILEEVDQQQHNLYHHHLSPSPPPPTTTPPPIVLVDDDDDDDPQTQVTVQHLSATKIQAAYRAHMAQKNSKSLTNGLGLVRLQGVVRGQHVKRQTVNAMKQMQLLVRLQTQIHSRRIHNQQPLPHPNNLNLLQSEMGEEYWDDSLITKEEREARLHRKVEALNRRDKAMAYAYSHQLWKATPKSATHNSLMDIRYAWWWNRLERQFPSQVKNHQFATTPSRETPPVTVTPHLIKKQNHSVGAASPMSSRSMVPPRTRQQRMKYSIKDDNDSLMSCPAFSVPNYMTPTVSAKAKARPTSNPRDRMPTTPGRFSFPPTPNSEGSFNWNKGSGKHKSPASIGELSMDSAISVGGRKPFNRFV